MRKAIAIDFDGCLCTDAYPEIGEPNWPVIRRAQAEQRAGAGLILWTCREGQLLLDAIDACKGWGLTFDAVNESLPDWIEEFGTRPRKVGASEYWDDKAVQLPIASPSLPGMSQGAVGLTLRKTDLRGKCGSCNHYEPIGQTACGSCLKRPYGSDVAHDPKHPYVQVTRSRIKCARYEERREMCRRPKGNT